jgi:nitrogen fixation protein NifX
MSSVHSAVQMPAELALRVALAARELDAVDSALLLRAVLAITGEPLSAVRMERVRIARLRTRLQEQAACSGIDLVLAERQLQRAVSLLRGRGVQMPQLPLPVPHGYREGELHDSLRIACASNRGECLDGCFANCARFLIYQVSATADLLIELRAPLSESRAQDRLDARAELLNDCHLLYTLSIGGPAAAKVVRAGIHPLKVDRAVPAREIIGQLQQVLAGAPPPWLVKAMEADKPGRLHGEWA